MLERLIKWQNDRCEGEIMTSILNINNINSLFLWIITKTKNILKILDSKMGPDPLDHTLLHWNSINRYLLKEEPDLILPEINTDNSLSEKARIGIVNNYYGILSHYHKYGSISSYKGFYIMRLNDEFINTEYTLRSAYNSPLRKDLPTREGSLISYINFHRVGIYTDGSSGCFSTRKDYFDRFRNCFSDLEKGILIYKGEM